MTYTTLKCFYRSTAPHTPTSGGQSGSAVWAPDINGVPECLAIHTTGKSPRVEGNGAVRINEENFDILTDWVKFYQKSNNL